MRYFGLMKPWNENINIMLFIYYRGHMTLNGLFTYLFGMRFIHYETYFFCVDIRNIFPLCPKASISISTYQKRLPEYLNCSLWCLRCNLIQKLNVIEYENMSVNSLKIPRSFIFTLLLPLEVFFEEMARVLKWFS